MLDWIFIIKSDGRRKKLSKCSAVCEYARESWHYKIRYSMYHSRKSPRILAMTSTYYATLLYCTLLCTDAFVPVRKRANTRIASRLAGAAEHQIFLPRKGARTNCIKQNRKFGLGPLSGPRFAPRMSIGARFLALIMADVWERLLGYQPLFGRCIFIRG